jgi:hypothetical protein
MLSWIRKNNEKQKVMIVMVNGRKREAFQRVTSTNVCAFLRVFIADGGQTKKRSKCRDEGEPGNRKSEPREKTAK